MAVGYSTREIETATGTKISYVNERLGEFREELLRVNGVGTDG